MSNIDKAAEHLGAGALKMIKLILQKHDAAVIEASMEAIEQARKEEREACANLAEDMANTAAHMNKTWRNGCLDVAAEIRVRR
jgi:uncharacterized membrane protein